MTEFLESREFGEIMKSHIYNVIEFFIKEGKEFAVASEIEHISFEPALSKEIVDNFAPISLFVLSGYTFETLTLDSEKIVFEAGFGNENIGSFVTIPLLAIKHILIDDFVIVVNMATYKEEDEVDNKIEHSMEVFLNNPENAKIIKKSKDK